MSLGSHTCRRIGVSASTSVDGVCVHERSLLSLLLSFSPPNNSVCGYAGVTGAKTARRTSTLVCGNTVSRVNREAAPGYRHRAHPSLAFLCVLTHCIDMQ